MGGSLLHAVLTSRVYDVARETPLDEAPRLSRRLGHEVLFKREDLQPVFSFKLRGAYNRIAHLSPEERARGVITASAGNHAQGVAFSARHLGLRAVIVMPKTTPEIKVGAVESLGAEVVLAGDSYSDAQAHCDDLVAQGRLTFIHPFDDPLVIAGQGTIGEEVLRQSHGRLDAVFVPVGGGGLIAGIAGYIKTLMPQVLVVGVEPFEADAMYRSLQAGERGRLGPGGLLAGVGEAREALLGVTIPERPGAFRAFCAVIGPRVVTEFNYRLAGREAAHIFVGLKTRSREDAREVAERLRGEGYPAEDLTDNEMAKLHVRHMVGGRAAAVRDERLYRFEFPERPGALMEFLQKLGDRWNISLFHYRNHGADFGRVLCGFEVPDVQRSDFQGFLDRLGYPFIPEEGNGAYELFLAGG